jgi:predicted AAA+ superfamily ATPase
VRGVKKQLGPLTQEERGSLLEGFVAVVLKAYGEYADLFDEMSFWSPLDAVKTDVDFLLKKGARFVAIEVKSSNRLGNDAFRGLRAIADLRGLGRRLLVYPGKDALRTDDGIEVWPVQRFFELVERGALF